MSRIGVTIGVAIVAGVLVAAASHGWLGGGRQPDKTADTEQRGPHGGRLLVAEDFALEVMVSGEGVSPKFRVYALTLDQKPIQPSAVQLRAVLDRSIGGSVERITFVPEANYLKSTSLIAEPHSFIVRMTVTYRGLSHYFTYDHIESGGHVTQGPADGPRTSPTPGKK